MSEDFTPSGRESDITFSEPSVNDGASTLTSPELYQAWLQVKRAELQAYVYRTETLEPEILKRLNASSAPIAKSESETIHDAGYKIKLVRNIAYKVDDQKQLELVFAAEPDLRPYTLKAAVSASQLVKLKETHPELYKGATKHLTAQENKTTVSIERKEEV